MSLHSTRVQFIRYALVGLASNALLYVFYIALTGIGAEPKVAMTLLYALGVAQSFVFNRRWSFRHGGQFGPTFARYCATYAFGYLINLFALLLLVDRFRFPHQVVQGIMIVLLALILFALQKVWVFRDAARFPIDTETRL